MLDAIYGAYDGTTRALQLMRMQGYTIELMRTQITSTDLVNRTLRFSKSLAPF